MSKARDRANRSGTDPVFINNAKLRDSSGNLLVQDASGNDVKLIAEELHLGDSADGDLIIMKRSSGGGHQFQNKASGSAAVDEGVGGVSAYATLNDLPTSASDGDQALIIATNILYIWKTSGWYKVATITNADPTISSAGNASYAFAMDGTPVSIEITATDPEVGTALQYRYQVSVGSIGSTAAVTSSATSGGTYSALAAGTLTSNKFFKVTPSTNAAHAGSFSLTFSASVGVNVATSSASAFTLEFFTYGSVSFDGTGDFLTIPKTADLEFGSGDFTFECWYRATSLPAYAYLFSNNVAFQVALNLGVPSVWISTNGDGIAYFATLIANVAVEGYNGTSVEKYKWNHIAVTRSGSDFRLFLNGVLAKSASSASTIGAPASAGTVIGGAGTTPIYPFFGDISNLRIIKGTALYTASFSVPTEPYTAVTNTKLYTCHKNNEVIDGSASSHTITKLGNAAANARNPFPWNTLGYGSMDLDKTGDYILPTPHADFNLGTGDFTIEGWAWPRGNGVGGIFQLSNTTGGLSTSTSSSLAFGVYASGTARWGVYGAGSTAATTTLRTLDAWQHFALQKTGGNLKTYVDGGEIDSRSDTTDYDYNKLIIGGWYSTGYLWDGFISNLRIVKGSTVYTPSTGTGGSISFPGTSNNVVIAGADSDFQLSTGDWTIEGWVYITAGSDNNGLWQVGGNNANGFGSNYTSSVSLVLSTADDLLKLYGAGGEWQLGVAGAQVRNAWTHYAMTKTGAKIRIYKNGTQIYIRDDTTNYGGTGYLGVGAAYGPTQTPTFKLNNFRVVKGTAVYTGNFTPPTGNLTATGGSYSDTTNVNTSIPSGHTSIILGQQSSGTLSDTSGNSHSLTVTGAAANTDNPWYGDITVPTTPLTAVTNTKLLTLQRSTKNAVTNGAYDFTTTSSRLLVESADFNLASSTPFTLEYWYQLKTGAGNGDYMFSTGTGGFIQLYLISGNIKGYASNMGGYWVDFGSGVGRTEDVWYHVAIAGDGSGNTKAYLDGTQVGSTHNGSWAVTGSKIRINGYAGAGYTSTGMVAWFADFRIVNGTQVYSGNFTRPSGPLTTTGGTYPSNTNVNTSITASHTKLLTCQNSSGALVDNSASNHTLTMDGTVTPIGGVTALALTDQSSGSHALTAYGDPVNAKYWPFNYS